MQYSSSLPSCHCRCLLDQHPESSPVHIPSSYGAWTRLVNRTTNVYINGLPPHFKAEQLYALASQFGTVLSCRTFAHQLSDLPSGYGFVLFNTVDAAQKCIDILRSHHNLHLTFAKQAHKIARSPPLINITNPHPSAAAYVFEFGLAHSTSYPHLNLGSSTSNSSIGMARGIGGAVGGGAMGGIEDGGDVYIEGRISSFAFIRSLIAFLLIPTTSLSMNIDVPALRVLIAPHVIRGSRFFADTRQPPQLVAYIQVASRLSFVGVPSFPISSVHILTGSRLSTSSFFLLISLLTAIYQDIYATPQAPHQQDTNNNNVGGSGNIHNATDAQRGYPNTNVNANGNGVGGGGGNQSQSQSPEGVAVGSVGGLGRMSMGEGCGISVEPLLHTLQGLGVGARCECSSLLLFCFVVCVVWAFVPSFAVPPLLFGLSHDPTTPGTGSATVPPPLQPISATLSQLQMQLESLRPLLAAYTNSNNANTTSDTTSNGTTTNNGINSNSHSHNTQSQSHSNSTSLHLQSVPIPNGNSDPNLTVTTASNTLNDNPNTNTNTKAFTPHRVKIHASGEHKYKQHQTT
ncbi:hypothetical protein M422DRAFT_258503 [Sphaerobolus stellatus SS14]|uniref:RRM domain-containing protein n=1 Tax=Sphaerobolus stellatus (strain SS14) TaxID=990650 RepID=A0A0C9UVI6_SPHS4|nr:hypothetical protein M422DRAFT_258503 [Sphaerobolus stellatus SS14]